LTFILVTSGNSDKTLPI